MNTVTCFFTSFVVVGTSCVFVCAQLVSASCAFGVKSTCTSFWRSCFDHRLRLT